MAVAHGLKEWLPLFVFPNIANHVAPEQIRKVIHPLPLAGQYEAHAVGPSRAISSCF